MNYNHHNNMFLLVNNNNIDINKKIHKYIYTFFFHNYNKSNNYI